MPVTLWTVSQSTTQPGPPLGSSRGSGLIISVGFGKFNYQSGLGGAFDFAGGETARCQSTHSLGPYLRVRIWELVHGSRVATPVADCR